MTPVHTGYDLPSLRIASVSRPEKRGEVEAWMRDPRLAGGRVETLRNYSWRAHADVVA